MPTMKGGFLVHKKGIKSSRRRRSSSMRKRSSQRRRDKLRKLRK